MDLDRGHGCIVPRATDSDAAFGFNPSRAVPPPPRRRDDLTPDIESSAFVRLGGHRCVSLEQKLLSGGFINWATDPENRVDHLVQRLVRSADISWCPVGVVRVSQ
nr:hypothetical protein [Mycobacterium sp. IS-1590]